MKFSDAIAVSSQGTKGVYSVSRLVVAMKEEQEGVVYFYLSAENG